MNWLTEVIIEGSGVEHSLVVFALTIALGTALGKIKICGVSLGATFILLVGMAISHLGTLQPNLLIDGSSHIVDAEVLRFVQEFGLILFVYAVGLRSGKGFFAAFKKGGILLNLLALAVIFGNVLIALAVHWFADIPTPTTVGILSGAVTNTPGLGAAQSICKSLNFDESVLASAYAVAYPLAVIGIIFTIIGVRIAFRIDLQKERERVQKEEAKAQVVGEEQPIPHRVPILQIFVGILLGVILGSIPVCFPGIPQPLKLGLAGGPLVVALLMDAFGEKIGFPTRISKNMLAFMSDIGNALFLSCVGLKAGETIGATLMNGGYCWVGYGLIITVVPISIVACVARFCFKIDYFTLAGMLAGSMTDPPALAYSIGVLNNDRVSLGYATVYPLTMFMRIMTAQLLLLFFLG